MNPQHIVCLVLGLACVALATLIALFTGLLAVPALMLAIVVLRLRALLRADGVLTRLQPAHAVAPARRQRRTRG